MLVLNKANIAKHPRLKEQFEHQRGMRVMFNQNERAMQANLLRAGIKVNQTSLIDREAWRQVDEMTMRVIRNDEGSGYMADLMRAATTVNLGKTASLYRNASDSGRTVVTMSGKVPETLDKTVYEYDGDPVPMFVTGYGREYREMLSFQSEGFDAIADDQESSLAGLRQEMAQYALDGDANINVAGYQSQGIRNHRNTVAVDLGVTGANIDLTSDATTNDQIVTFFQNFFYAILQANYTSQKQIKFWVSTEIMRRLRKPYGNSTEFKGGTLLSFLMGDPSTSFIASIMETYELSGNEFFAYACMGEARTANGPSGMIVDQSGLMPDPQFIRPIVGMAVSTFTVQRNNPMDDFNFVNWAAMGIRIRQDYNNRGGVYYASA